MSLQVVSRIFFIASIVAALVLIVNFAQASTSAIDSALDKSLQESRELNKELDPSFAMKPKASSHKIKARPVVQINMDEADAKNAAHYEEATSDLRESSY